MATPEINDQSTSNKRSVSTRTRWAYVKIERAAGPGIQGERSERRSRKGAADPLSDKDLRRTHTIQVVFRGGPECWWQLSDGRRTIRVPGHDCIHDALTWLLTPIATKGERAIR